MMGTRSGSVDPGIVIRLAEDGLGPGEIADGLAQRSGLRGMTGTADLREIEARARHDDAEAALALAVFCRRIAAGIAGAGTTLPGIDALVFTGGIGANSEAVRSDVLGRLRVLGFPGSEGPGRGDFVVALGPPAVLVIEAREDLVIAGEVEGIGS
jgi:acetate kinase